MSLDSQRSIASLGLYFRVWSHLGRKRRNDVVALLGFFVLAPIGVGWGDRVGVEKPEILFSIIKDIPDR
jgi:hypothetical protein